MPKSRMSKLVCLLSPLFLYFQLGCQYSLAGIVMQAGPASTVMFFGANPNNFAAEQDGVFELIANGHYASGAGPLFQGSFYGAAVDKVWVAENGNLNFGATGDGSFYSYPLTNNAASLRISPLGDDVLMLFGANNRILNHSLPGSYLAVTWQDIRLFNDTIAGQPLPVESRTAQVIWFESDQQIRGFEFKRNDIAFGYSGFGGGNIDATIGVKGLQSFTSLPGDVDGLISSSNNQNQLIPWADNEFLLFRPNENGTLYASTRETISAVPEPASIVVLSTTILGFMVLRGARALKTRSTTKCCPDSLER